MSISCMRLSTARRRIIIIYLLIPVAPMNISLVLEYSIRYIRWTCERRCGYCEQVSRRRIFAILMRHSFVSGAVVGSNVSSSFLFKLWCLRGKTHFSSSSFFSIMLLFIFLDFSVFTDVRCWCGDSANLNTVLWSVFYLFNSCYPIYVLYENRIEKNVPHRMPKIKFVW